MPFTRHQYIRDLVFTFVVNATGKDMPARNPIAAVSIPVRTGPMAFSLILITLCLCGAYVDRCIFCDVMCKSTKAL